MCVRKSATCQAEGRHEAGPQYSITASCQAFLDLSRLDGDRDGHVQQIHVLYLFHN